MVGYDKEMELARDELSSKVNRFVSSDKDDFSTLVVTGRRGSGKTTLLKMSLSDTPHVLNIDIQVNHYLDESMALTLLPGAPREIGIVSVQEALKKFKKKNGGKPETLVLSVAANCTKERFQDLLGKW